MPNRVIRRTTHTPQQLQFPDSLLNTPQRFSPVILNKTRTHTQPTSNHSQSPTYSFLIKSRLLHHHQIMSTTEASTVSVSYTYILSALEREGLSNNKKLKTLLTQVSQQEQKVGNDEHGLIFLFFIHRVRCCMCTHTQFSNWHHGTHTY